MRTDIGKYLISTQGLDLIKILSAWTWLTGNKKVIALTKCGDALLIDENDCLYFLDAGRGTIELKTKNYNDFFDNKLNDELTEDLLLSSLVDRLEYHGLRLMPFQVYSYTILPVLGGTYDEHNMYVLDIYEHYCLTGIIHNKLKNVADGTTIEIRVIP